MPDVRMHVHHVHNHLSMIATRLLTHLRKHIGDTNLLIVLKLEQNSISKK